MRIVDRLIAGLSVALYLAAAFLPCESPFSALPDGLQPSAAHALSVSGRARPVTPAAAPGDHAAHAHHGSPATGQAHHAKRTPAATEPAHHAKRTLGSSGHAHHANRTRAVVDHADHEIVTSATPSELELKPTCLCGCQKTRAEIGGGTARLGAAVPASVTAPWPVEPRILPSAEPPIRAVAYHPEIDPIPI